jgi:hypothetical protein
MKTYVAFFATLTGTTSSKKAGWLRTLPYVRSWAARYKEQGLVVVGVHTPEFTFEDNVDSVRRSAKERGVTYPTGAFR